MAYKPISNAFEELWLLLRGAFGTNNFPETEEQPQAAAVPVETQAATSPSEALELTDAIQKNECPQKLTFQADATCTMETPSNIVESQNTTSPVEQVELPDASLEQPLSQENEAKRSEAVEKEINQKLLEIRKYAAWDGPDAERISKNLTEIFSEQYPEFTAQLEKAIEEGIAQKRLLNKAFELGRSSISKQRFSEWVNSISTQIQPADRPNLIKKLRNKYERGAQIAKRTNNDYALKKSGQPMSNLKLERKHSKMTIAKTPNAPLSKRHNINTLAFAALHPNDIRALQPRSEWTLLIDESGSYFEETPQQVKQAKRGRFVGLLIPAQNTPLPSLPKGWHAVEQDSSEAIDAAMQPLLNAEVGILGIELESLPPAQGERWMDGVGLLIDWILRLLPIEGNTRLNIRIENRGVFTVGANWELLRRDCIRRLALAFPKQAMKIDLDIRVIDKQGHPCNGYVDAIAYTWARTNDFSKARLKQSGLLGTCLLDANQGADARSMLHAWDAFSQGVNLPPEIWWTMLGSPDSRDGAALLSHLLTLIGNEAKADAKVWLPYLQEVKNRMAYGPIDLKMMEPAIDWLQTYCPPDAQILPAMRLIWLTVQLARANHQGEVENRWQQELKQLGDRLFEEAAPLVCHAELHLAVNYTNRFDFAAASQALARWQDVPPSVPGLRFWAHVQSSLGQHAAFTDDPAKAVMYFKTALDAMQRLSDPDAKARDLSQTGTYLAIAAMDNPATPDSEVREYVEKITGPLPEAAGRLATSGDSSERYTHHLLLRWLTHRGDAASTAAYLAKRANWQSGSDHPWPLIELYRGMLLRATEPETARNLALKAAEMAFNSHMGPTVHLIGACCRLIAMQWGADWSDGATISNTLKKELPAATDRITQIQRALPPNPLAILKTVLTFNFR